MNQKPSQTRKFGWLILFIGVVIYSGEILSTIIGVDPTYPPILANFRLFGLAVACWGVWYSYYDQSKVYAGRFNFRLMIFLSLVVIVAFITSLKLAGIILL